MTLSELALVVVLWALWLGLLLWLLHGSGGAGAPDGGPRHLA